MKLRTKILMLTVLLALSLASVGTLRTSAGTASRQKPPLFVVQTSEADKVESPSAGALPRTDPQGRVYVVADSDLRILSSTGERLGGFHLPVSNPSTGIPFAVLSGGEIVVATCDEDALLTVFDASGKLVRKMGTLRKLDERNPARNRFLNLGMVEANPSGEVFFVPMFSPTPTVQKFSRTGKLLTEFSVNGVAEQYQLEQAKKFLDGKGGDTVGGFFVLKSAAVDPATGHLWIGVNGRSQGGPELLPESGILYEYSGDGEKLAEYALVVTKSSGSEEVLIQPDDISVHFPYARVLTFGQIYTFDVSLRSVPKDHLRRAI